MDNENNDIGNSIKYFRELNRLSQANLARQIGVSQRNVSYYESGDHIPPADILKKLASIFGITVDELIGVKKMNSTSNCYNYFYEEGNANWNIRKISESKGISYDVLLEKSCIDKVRLDALWFGTSQPVAEELIRISKVLGVSIDYLLDNSLRECISAEDELILRYFHKDPENIMMLLESFECLSKKNRAIVVGKCLELERDESVAADNSLEKTGTTNSAK